MMNHCLSLALNKKDCCVDKEENSDNPSHACWRRNDRDKAMEMKYMGVLIDRQHVMLLGTNVSDNRQNCKGNYCPEQHMANVNGPKSTSNSC